MAEDASAAPVTGETAPAQAMSYVGIDLGALNLVAVHSSAAEPTAMQIAVNEVSNRATPATVCFDGKLRLIGDSAEAKMTQLPKQTIQNLCAVQGSTDAAQAVCKRLNSLWNITESGNIGPVPFGDREELELRPASALAALLRKVVSFAMGDAAVEEGAAQTFELAVSVPDVWSEAEFANLRAAVDILGWKPELVHVVPFSYAIATAYAQRMGDKLGADETERIVAFADVGFSQTTVSIAKFTPAAEGAEKQELSVEAISCQSAPVGVQNFVGALAAHLIKDMKEPVDLRSKRGARLVTALNKGVKELSGIPETKVAIECFYSDEGDWVADISRTLLNEVVADQLQSVVDLGNKALADAGITAADVHSLELVGGGKSIPKVQQILSEQFPQTDAAADAIPGALSSRLRFGLDGASAMGTGTALYAAGKRALKTKFDLANTKSSLDEAALTECRELESWMFKVNKEEVARLEMSNTLEGYIYKIRDWLSGPDRALLKPETIEAILDKEQMWFEDAMYDENTTLQVYTEHMDQLTKQVEEHGCEFFAKKQKEKEQKDKFLDEEAEKERQRRKDCGMDDDKDDRKMAKSERIKMAGKNKEEGNTVLKAGNLEDAAGRYMRALQHLKKFYMLDLSPEDKAEGDAISLSVQLNLAMVYLKQAAQVEKDAGKEKAEAVWIKAKTAATEALAVDEDNVKAKFRKASAMEKLGDLDGAAKEVKSALKTDPENADLLKLLERLEKLHKIQNEKARKMYGKMFG